MKAYMASLIRVAGAFALFALIAPAHAGPVQKGAKAFNKGRFSEAQALWTPSAHAGEPYAQFNMGRLWEQGHVSGDASSARVSQARAFNSNLEEAAEWYAKAGAQGHVTAIVSLGRIQLVLGYISAAQQTLTVAARWADPTAQQLLVQLGAPIPHPDLAIAQQQQLQQREQLGLALGLGAACVAVGGCAPPVSIVQPTTNVLPPAASAPKPVSCRLNPVFKDMFGNPTVECKQQ